jgi:hypothetical protein
VGLFEWGRNYKQEAVPASQLSAQGIYCCKAL